MVIENNVNNPHQSTYSQGAAKEYVENTFGHHIEMLKALDWQVRHSLEDSEPGKNAEAQKNIHLIHAKATENLKKIQAKITEKLTETDKPLSKKEITDLRKQLKEAEKESAKEIKRAQIRTLKVIAAANPAAERTQALDIYINKMMQGGWRAVVLKAKSHIPLLFPGTAAASKSYQEARAELEASSKAYIVWGAKPQVQEDIRKEFIEDPTKALSKRAGVVGYGSIYRISITFDDKKIRKQLQSFKAQQLSQTERRTIANKVSDKTGAAVLSKFVPLNDEFDQTKGVSSIFGKIYGKKGLSSANRFEAHAVNAGETMIEQDGERLFTGLRHAILSSKLEKDRTKRAEQSKQMAKEVVEAAVIQQISEQAGGIPNTSPENPMSLDFFSVSLVTPDRLSKMKDGLISERAMLKDQDRALKSLAVGVQEFKIGDQTVFVKVNPITFNFGVNAGAMGTIKPLMKTKLGLKRQHELNTQSFGKLSKKIEGFVNDPLVSPEKKEAVKDLWNDIQHIATNEESYQYGGNQYELGAKLLLLSNRLNRKDQGVKCAFNCKSGKDRTGEMDAMVKAFAVIGKRHGKIPTSVDFRTNKAIREEFVDILVNVMKEGGGLDVTGLNTQARGYKLSKEAMVWGMSEEDFRQIQGLSKLTSS